MKRNPVRSTWRTCVVAALAAAALLASGGGTAHASAPPMSPMAAQDVRSTLAQRLVPHTSVGIDPATGQVVLTVGTDAVGTDGLMATARGFGPAVRVDKIPGGFYTVEGHFRGGNGIVSTDESVTCTLAFNLTQGFALTAGHCTQLAAAWNKENNGLFIGPTIDSRFPKDDYGLIRNEGPMTPKGDVQAYDAGVIDITGAANPFVEQRVCKSGRTTQRTCGRVTQLDLLVEYPQGSVDQLIETNVCVQPGDSGGPLYDGGTALGITSGGTLGLPCSSPRFRSFFQPVTEPLDRYQLRVF